MARIGAEGLAILAAVLMISASGCTVSVQPWTKPSGPASHPGPTGEFAGGVPYRDVIPASAQRPGMGNIGPEVLVKMNQHVNELEDQRKALQDQVYLLRKQLKDREDKLTLASHEMEESSKQIKRTRDDFGQWQAEMSEIRDRLRKLEDGRAVLRREIDQILLEFVNDKEIPKPRTPVRSPK